MPIPIRCDCGASFNVPDHMAGRRGRCGKCKAPIVVPPLEPDPFAIGDDDATAALAASIDISEPDDPPSAPAPPARAAVAPDDSPTPPRRRRHARLAAVVVAVVVAGGIAGREALRSADLRSKLAGCPSAEGMTVAVSYASPFDDDIVFDFRGASGRTRKVDLLHLLLQFGRSVDGYGYGRMWLRSAGSPRFVIFHPDMAELSKEYTVGNPLWSITKWPSRLRKPDGTKAHGEWTGGMLGVMRGEMEDLNESLDEMMQGVAVE